MKAWHLETEISVTLTSASCPRPKETSSSSEKHRIWTTLEVFDDILSSTMYCGSSSDSKTGKSYSSILNF